MGEEEVIMNNLLPPESSEGKQLLYEKFLANEDSIFEIEQSLRGYYKKINGNQVQWTKSNTKPIMNEVGIQFISSTIRRYMNRNNTISNYTPDKIDSLILREIHGFATTLYLNSARFELDRTYFRDIVNSVHTTAQSSFNRATSRSEARDLLGANKTATVINSGQQQQQGVLSSIFPGR